MHVRRRKAAAVILRPTQEYHHLLFTRHVDILYSHFRSSTVNVKHSHFYLYISHLQLHEKHAFSLHITTCPSDLSYAQVHAPVLLRYIVGVFYRKHNWNLVSQLIVRLSVNLFCLCMTLLFHYTLHFAIMPVLLMLLK